MQNNFLKSSVLFLEIRLNVKRHSSLKVNENEIRNVQSLIISFLNFASTFEARKLHLQSLQS
jgi:hypothetical protein